MESLDTFFLGILRQHSMGRSLQNIFRPWFKRPLICLSVEPHPSRKQPRTTSICTQANSIPSFKKMRVASISAALLGKNSTLLWLKRRPFLPKASAISCVLLAISTVELETRKMLSAHTKISNGTHSRAQDTAGARPAHSRVNSSTNTAMIWFQTEGVHGPPCLMLTSRLNEALCVKPRHCRARGSRCSLTAAAAEKAEAPLSNNTSPNTSALTESNALATSMETTNSFSPHSSALRRLSTRKETIAKHCLPGLNPN